MNVPLSNPATRSCHRETFPTFRSEVFLKKILGYVSSDHNFTEISFQEVEIINNVQDLLKKTIDQSEKQIK